MRKVNPLFILFLIVIFASCFLLVFKAAAVKSDNSNQDKNTERIASNSGDDENENEASDSENFEDIASKSQGQFNAEQHRSIVANFVQNLLKVASRQEGGIGDQVRVVAQQQNDSKEREAQAIEKVQKRGKFRTFLIGTDYKNLGQLRNETVQTRN